MRLDLLDVKNFIGDRHLPEVTSSNLFNSKTLEPDPEGLASFEIFGKPGTLERKNSFAYIDLGDIFLHPHVYIVLTRLQRNFKECIDGEGTFFVDYNGKLTRLKDSSSPPKNRKTGTGIRFLYQVYNDIDLKPKKDMPQMSYDMRKFLSTIDREEAFISQMLVIPPFYRDVDMSSRKKHMLNILYNRLISNAAAIRTSSQIFALLGSSSAHKKIQETIQELYLYFIDIIGGTHGIIHRTILGKATDYSARLVISMPKYDAQTVDTTEVSFDKSAVPLGTIVKIFSPFIKYGVKNIINSYLSGSKFIYYQNAKGKVEQRELAPHYMDAISGDNLDKLINLYSDSKEHRLDIFTLPTIDGKNVPVGYMYNDPNQKEGEKNSFGGSDEEVEELLLDQKISPLNLTELFYMAAYDTVKDKCVYITRYPIETAHNIYPSMMNIIPCSTYSPRTISRGIGFSIDYPHFPITPKGSKTFNVQHLFSDTLKLNVTYLQSLGGDFDGDQVSIQSVYTNEANEAAKKYIHSKLNILNINGTTMRTFPEVSQLGMYNLTYRYNKPT
jgi:hypothetical protein